MTPPRRWEGLDGSLVIRRPAPGVAVVELSGHDVGEYGEQPFAELAPDLETEGGLELFLDARAAKAASIEVSGHWAGWLGKQKARLRRVHFLTGSRFLTLSAEFVKAFSGLGELMRVYTNAADFDVELALTASRRRAGVTRP